MYLTFTELYDKHEILQEAQLRRETARQLRMAI